MMNSPPPGALDLIIPVAWIIGLAAIVVGTIVATVRRVEREIKTMLREELQGALDSERFRTAVAKLISDGQAGYIDLQNRMHEEHRRGIAELRKRDDERAQAITRLHERVDRIIEGGGE